MPTGADLGPEDHTHCHTCQQPLGPTYWIEDCRWPVHTDCVDWKRRPFLFDPHLHNLRRRYADPGIADLVRWLESARRRWPDGALEIVKEGIERLRVHGLW